MAANLESVVEQLKSLEKTQRRILKVVLVTKTCASAGAEGAEDVVSEHITAGTDWDFDFGGTGYITRAVITSVTAMTPRMALYLFTNPPTCNLLDNVANTAPIAADIQHFVGSIEFPAMIDYGTGASYAVATPSTTGNLPLMFNAPKLYGVLVTKDAVTFGATLISIILGAEIEGS